MTKPSIKSIQSEKKTLKRNVDQIGFKTGYGWTIRGILLPSEKCSTKIIFFESKALNLIQVQNESKYFPKPEQQQNVEKKDDDKKIVFL